MHVLGPAINIVLTEHTGLYVQQASLHARYYVTHGVIYIISLARTQHISCKVVLFAFVNDVNFQIFNYRRPALIRYQLSKK